MSGTDWPGGRTRKVTKELFDISKNAVLVGGVEYFADKSKSRILWWLYAVLFFDLLMHVNSYMQGPAVAGWIERRWGWGRRPAKAIGWGLTLAFLFAFILVTDQAINEIARAQVK